MKFLGLALVAFGILCPSIVQTAPLTLELSDAGLDSLEYLQRRANTTDTSDTRNDIVDKAACEAATVIFARGTTESGNVGAVAGPPFFTALATALGAAPAVQGVTYAADIAGFLEGGDPTGSATMATLVTTTISQCPDTKIVMSGYSQGGQLVHNAAKTLGTTMASIGAVVIFGDPDNGTAVSGIDTSLVDIICHTGDDICLGGDSILAAHLTYGTDATAAADFVKTALG